MVADRLRVARVAFALLASTGCGEPVLTPVPKVASPASPPAPGDEGPPPPAAPAPPTALSASPVSATRIDLVWSDPNTEETGYRVERRAGAASFAVVGSLPPDSTSFQDAGLDERTTYDYAVFAEGAGGASEAARVTQRTLARPVVSWGAAPNVDAACGFTIPAQVTLDPLLPPPALQSVSGTVEGIATAVTASEAGLAGTLTARVRGAWGTTFTVTDVAGGVSTLDRLLRLDFVRLYDAPLAPVAAVATLGEDAITGRQVPSAQVLPPGECSGCGGRRGSISAGNGFTLALTSDGRVLGWGDNARGKLGDGTNTRRPVPAPVCASGSAGDTCVPLGGVEAIVAGRESACAVLSDGTARCWGRNAEGQLGDGTTAERRNPAMVCASGRGPGCEEGAALDAVVSLAAGWTHACAVRGDGSAWCWGSNGNGQLGDGTLTDRRNPVPVCASGAGPECTGGARLGGVVAVAVATDSHSCALTEGGEVLCWGLNSIGQLGDGTTTSRPNPVNVCSAGQGPGCEGGAVLSGVIGLDLVRGARYVGGTSHAVLATGALHAWPDATWHASAVCYSGPDCPLADPVDDAAAVVSAMEYSCVLRRSGTVRCQGANVFGELGDGTGVPSPGVYVDVPLAGVVALASAPDGLSCDASARCPETSPGPVPSPGHTCALLAAGSLRCWGYDASGQVGDGTLSPALSPTPVCAAGAGAACVPLDDLAVRACGQWGLFAD